MWNWNIAMKSGETITVEGADAYCPEGPLTTFFCTGSNRQTIDSWSTRISSYRTADIVTIERAKAEAIELNTPAVEAVEAVGAVGAVRQDRPAITIDLTDDSFGASQRRFSVAS